MTIHIGTSGWSYDHWQHIVYPPDIPLTQRLSYYVKHFGTVELNSSFYHWPRDTTFAGWRARLPEGFRLSVKAPRGMTHARQLYAPETWIGRVTRGLGHLGDRRGVLLVQLPPQLPCDPPRLQFFLKQMPPWIQLALEFRHPSWHTDQIWHLLEQHAAAYCVMSGAGLPCVLRATAPLVYVRLHGPDHHYLYAGSYSDSDLGWWAEQIWRWAEQGRDVYAYFNNDGYGFAVHNAARLRQILGV